MSLDPEVPACKPSSRMVEGHELRAEVVNNAFATVPTHRKRFVIDSNHLRKRMHRGKCVVSTLRAPFLSSGNPTIGQIRISVSLGPLEPPRRAWIFGDISKNISKLQVKNVIGDSITHLPRCIRFLR